VAYAERHPLSVGREVTRCVVEPLSAETLGRLYRDHAEYVDCFNRRLDELVEDGWLLGQDAEEMRVEAKGAAVP
jgi:hypothetical protein